MSDMPLTLDRVQAIVEHLLTDGSRMGLILGNELNTAMGASARRRAQRTVSRPNVGTASATWVEPTGQMRYTVTWDGTDLYLSGENLNDGTVWASERPIDKPERFGPSRTGPQFFAWVAAFAQTEEEEVRQS